MLENYELSDVERYNQISQAQQANNTAYAYRPQKDEGLAKWEVDHTEHIMQLSMCLRGYIYEKC